MPATDSPGPSRDRLLTLAVAICVGLMLGLPRLDYLPRGSDEAQFLIAALLTAQATITALTLSISVFVMQVVGARRDAEDRIYEEYRRRSGVNYIFPWSLIAVGGTALALIAEVLVDYDSPLLGFAPGLHNLTLLAMYAFFANLALAGALYWRGIRLAAPDAWRELRRDVYEREVRRAVEAFLRRVQGMS